jgi:hypothetical protein
MAVRLEAGLASWNVLRAAPIFFRDSLVNNLYCISVQYAVRLPVNDLHRSGLRRDYVNTYKTVTRPIRPTVAPRVPVRR